AAEAKALSRSLTCPIAFSSEVDTGSREENASKQESRASVLIQSEPIALDDTSAARPKTKKIAQPRPATLRARQPRSPPQAGAMQWEIKACGSSRSQGPRSSYRPECPFPVIGADFGVSG